MNEVIDFHTHNFPEELAPRAVAAMVERLRGSLVPAGDGTIATQLKDMAAAGVGKSVVCPVATKSGQFRAIIERAKAVRGGEAGEEAANRLVQLCSVHPADPDFAAHVKETAESGFKGIKIHPYYQGFMIDDPAFFPYFKAIRDAGLFVIAHCGMDPGFPGAEMAASPKQIATMLRAVPGLVFVAGHLGGCGGNPPHAVDELLEFPDCYVDTAVIREFDDDPEAQRVAAEWPAERMLYATDYFWRSEKFVADWVKKHRPNSSDWDKIFSANACRLLGL